MWNLWIWFGQINVYDNFYWIYLLFFSYSDQQIFKSEIHSAVTYFVHYFHYGLFMRFIYRQIILKQIHNNYQCRYEITIIRRPLMVFLIFFTRSKCIFSFVKPLYFDNTQYIIIDCAGTRHNTIINSDNQININRSSYFLQ